MDLFESVYVDELHKAYINITKKKLYINKSHYQFDFIITKIFYIKNSKVYMGCEFGILKFDYKTLERETIYHYKKENFRSNDGAYLNGKFYLGYMSKEYDTKSNCTSSDGFIVEFSDEMKIIEENIGIPNYMGMYNNKFIYVDSKTRSLNGLGNQKLIEFAEVVDGGFKINDSLFLCCYDAAKIVKCDLLEWRYTNLFETTDVPTSCCLYRNTMYYTSSTGFNVKKEIKI